MSKDPVRFADIKVADVLRAVVVLAVPVLAALAFWVFFVAVAP